MANTKRDPVCGMEVDERSARGESKFEGENYYFCSHTCKEKFDRNPEMYASQKGQSARGTS
jgi:Cu+-exporting ATPase